MIITKISAQQKDPNRVNVFIDGVYGLSLTLDQLLVQKLKVGTEVSDNDIKTLQKLSEDGKLRSRALEWVMLRPRSSKELRIYLQKKKADQGLIDALLQEFATKKYQDDEYFARWWVENRVRKNKSNIAIRAELMQKGISNTIIADVLQTSGAQKERLTALVAQKKLLSKYQTDPNKFKKYLLGKGFSYSEIDEVLADDSDAEDGSF